MLARRTAAVLLAALLGIGLAACGDDGGSNDDAVDQVDRDTSSNDDDADDDSTDDDSTDDDDLDLPDGIFGSEECAEIVEALGAFGQAFGGSGEFDFGDMADGLESLAGSAPEIAGDLEVMAEAYASFDEALGDDVDFSDPATFSDPAVLAASQAMSSPEFTAASDNVSAFMDDACAE